MKKTKDCIKPPLSKDLLKKVLALLVKETRAETMGRHGNLQGIHQAAFKAKLETLDELRRLLFGTDDLIELGIDWGLLEKDPTNRLKKANKKATAKAKKELEEFF